ncbi:putative Amino-acid acetyltransferase, mitochondrial [Venustampulla echinocandica]|uniref:Amino-acid acetyltransferase, mitochondrial n=1 Tax=Venustampulla echinocandica TaxID=2656787 RepID=A0A370TFM3_9HELO|nr:putative Amino-acid acetyltransferase, mitochondrial [Venustampulla echinocandica]RDL33697.1 putative Amino-acid acetyltransferase, mitochondrial [Venustampulla echinocandica]
MILQNIALKEGKTVAGGHIRSWATYKQAKQCCHKDATRYYSTNRDPDSHSREELAKAHARHLANNQKARKDARAIDKDFFMSVLSSSATKREAKSYLQRFTPSKTPIAAQNAQSPKNGVNLGSFYAPTAVLGSPKFIRNPQDNIRQGTGSQLHTALVKIRAPQTLDDSTLHGIGKTLSQLGRLGLISVVVVDCNSDEPLDLAPSWRALATKQANRIVAAIESSGGIEARMLDNIIGVGEGSDKPQYGNLTRPRTHVTLRKLLMTPLRRGVIPVVPSLAYNDVTQTAIPVTAAETVLALVRELTGLPVETPPDEDPAETKERLRLMREEVSLDRLIILDPLGGIPTSVRPDGYHVFLNMEQEYGPAKRHLLEDMQAGESRGALQIQSDKEHVSDLGMSNPFSKFVEVEFGSPGAIAKRNSPEPDTARDSTPRNWYHLQNLELARSVLTMLPPSSSALLTTPEEAANSGKETPFQAVGVGTRRVRNPLIHNLLTDKPVFSSSLPIGRLGQTKPSMASQPVYPALSITPTTFAKHGMPITIFPNPEIADWEAPELGKPPMTLTDSQIDLPRLIHLIEDSFGRKLDVQDYINRVNGRIAGVIIAGEYEGGALLTWELPPGVVDDGSPESRARMVPYLDKFAVLKKSQGSGGVADAVFTAMVRDCFPRGVVWRSRTTNVVNNWYFERSRGTWKLPGAGWTMFWTTPDMDRRTFMDYEGVCRGIEPSWADNKAVLD